MALEVRDKGGSFAKLSVDLDADTPGSLELRDPQGGTSDHIVEVCLFSFDDKPFLRPRAAGDTRVPEMLSYPIPHDGKRIRPDGKDWVGSIGLFNDDPLAQNTEQAEDTNPPPLRG